MPQEAEDARDPDAGSVPVSRFRSEDDQLPGDRRQRFRLSFCIKFSGRRILLMPDRSNSFLVCGFRFDNTLNVEVLTPSRQADWPGGVGFSPYPRRRWLI